MIDKIRELTILALKAHKDNGTDAKDLEEGDKLVTTFNDGVIILSMNGSKLTVDIDMNKALHVDFTFYESEDK